MSSGSRLAIVLKKCLTLFVLVGLGAPPASAGLYKDLTETPASQQNIVSYVRANPYAESVMRPVDKLCRGLINTLTGVLEIPRTVGETMHQRGFVAGYTTGVARGLKRVGIRTGAGLIDIVTFPVAPYHRLYITPEFVAGAASLYRGIPQGLIWEAVEAPGPPLPDGPVAAPITVLTAPFIPPPT